MKIENTQSENARRISADMWRDLEHGEILFVEVDGQTFIKPSSDRKQQIHRAWDSGNTNKLRVVTPSNTYYWDSEYREIAVIDTPIADGGHVHCLANWGNELYTDIARAQYDARMDLESFPELVEQVQSFAEKAIEMLRKLIVANPWQRQVEVQIEIPPNLRDQGEQFTAREAGRTYPPKFHDAVIMLLDNDDVQVKYIVEANAILFHWNFNPQTLKYYDKYVDMYDADARFAQTQQRSARNRSSR